MSESIESFNHNVLTAFTSLLLIYIVLFLIVWAVSYKVFQPIKDNFYKQKQFIKKVNKKYPYENCKYVVTLSNGEFYRICPKECFDDFIYAFFEGYSFRIPKNYKTWLTILYGEDYMTPPPVEKQMIHDVEIYWR